MKRYRWRTMVCLLGWMVGCAVAQEGGGVKLRLLAFSRVGADQELQVVDGEGKALTKHPMALPTQQLSAVEEVKLRALTFVAKDEAKRVLGKVVLPASGDEFILVFLPNAAGASEAYRVDAVALASRDFQSGDYAFLNYSGTAVGCDVGGERLMVAAGKSAIFSAFRSGKEEGNRPLVCYRQKDGAWESTPFLSSRLIIQKGVRNLILIGVNPKSGEIDFRGVPDFVE